MKNRHLERIIRILILSLCISIQLYGHSGKPKYHVIIDTDGALDDMRALSVFLSGNDIRVLAITCSQGSLMPDAVHGKVETLLSVFHHEGIPTGISEPVNTSLPAWSPFALNIDWGNGTTEMHNPVPKTNSVQLMDRVTSNYEDKITLIALGSLKTFADWLVTNPENKDKIDRVIWYNNGIPSGFNYMVSPESFRFFKESKIPLHIVANSQNTLIVDTAYFNVLNTCNTRYAKHIVQVHKQQAIVEKINQNHLRLWDDLVPLYLTVPLLFDVKKDNNLHYVSLQKAMPERFVFDITGELLTSTNQTNNMVFNDFPTDTSLYKAGYAKIVHPTIAKYGPEEWKAITMTNEIHGHTGIYSIIGAKMGIRAMEYFNVGVNNLYVTSYAGKKPPLSCFNDGIQISTGATLGQGLIEISDSISNIPSALFRFNNQTLLLSVHEHIAKQMHDEIKTGVSTHGLLTDRYWLYIENLAIKYWAEMDRNKLFKIQKMTDN
jgi:inosine-uridine nucleoside N-ribohydrolase/formylmethanofuran dehydrogenase subunit E